MLEQCDGNEELLAQLVALFHENIPVILRGINEATQQRDAGALTARAHKLVGSLGVFGAVRAGDLALQLEAAAQGSDFTGAEERIEKLGSQLTEFTTRLLLTAKHASDDDASRSQLPIKRAEPASFGQNRNSRPKKSAQVEV